MPQLWENRELVYFVYKTEINLKPFLKLFFYAFVTKLYQVVFNTFIVTVLPLFTTYSLNELLIK